MEPSNNKGHFGIRHISSIIEVVLSSEIYPFKKLCFTESFILIRKYLCLLIFIVMQIVSFVIILNAAAIVPHYLLKKSANDDGSW